MGILELRPQEIGARIAEARKSSGFRVKAKFARVIGAEPKTLSRLERGANMPTTRVLSAIADATGVSTDWLLTGEGQGPQASKAKTLGAA